MLSQAECKLNEEIAIKRQHEVEHIIERFYCEVCGKLLLGLQRRFCSTTCNKKRLRKRFNDAANYKLFVSYRKKRGLSINCKRCRMPILAGQKHISRPRHKIYHEKCFESMRI